ncbi:hypothetical protein RND71_021685 [Anisodus tanguticus]|uniref:Uncharacterized protein n=1 Tax=Anisodus tanguticus TaxID=243964 RepID=A0AAE1VD41_9SOLA|nr:hypothetical protein RND71_021685 [Anisodus tanguticus]
MRVVGNQRSSISEVTSTNTGTDELNLEKSPYARSSKNSDLDSRKSLPPVGNEREWEEARCPICMEHPHNAVLLLCSSRDKGAQQEGDNVSGAVFRRGSWGQALSGATRSHVQKQPELACPLCRGHVEGWIVVEAVRNFMNSKTRSCALGTCNFTGNYAELRKHARREHPSEGHVRLTLCGSLTGQDWSFKGTLEMLSVNIKHHLMMTLLKMTS